jgi:hypothetical protein
MTIREAAEMLWGDSSDAARWRLYRRVKAREKQRGIEIFSRAGAGPRSKLLLTVPALRKHMPELFSPRDEMAEKIEEAVVGIWAELRRARERDKGLGARIVAVESALIKHIDGAD